MTGRTGRAIGYGEPAPALSVRTTAKTFLLSSLAGTERTLVFVGALGGPGAAGRLAACRDLLARHASSGLLLVAPEPTGDPAAELREPGLAGRVVLDGDGRAASAFGVDLPTPEAAVAFRLDRALRIAERRPLDRLDELPALLARWQAETAAPPRLAGRPPVLELDKVFEPDFAAALIRWNRTADGADSGFMVRDGDRTVGRVDHRIKRRWDTLVTDPVLVDQCCKRLVLRLGPAIETAFQFRATRIERYLVARYEAADGGMFRAHRDNESGGTAHRRFAVSVNLNDDYEGGCLRFPEFGDELYRPAAGSALVFSCSLLHEATPVTAGTRYTFVTFLYGEEDVAKLRGIQSPAAEGAGVAKTG